ARSMVSVMPFAINVLSGRLALVPHAVQSLPKQAHQNDTSNCVCVAARGQVHPVFAQGLGAHRHSLSHAPTTEKRDNDEFKRPLPARQKTDTFCLGDVQASLQYDKDKTQLIGDEPSANFHVVVSFVVQSISHTA
ncbi:hypothetical protein EDB83DRAFT_2368130, partial [Lactarius deliciosus]